MREADPAQLTTAHRTGSYALASSLHQPRSKQKIIGDLKLFESKTMCPLIAVRDREER
jgi:hypothetical protein